MDFFINNAVAIVSVISVGVLIYVLVNWSKMPFVQRMVGLQFFFVCCHIFEELHFPGGFTELVHHKLGFELTNPHFGEMVLAITVLVMSIPPLFMRRPVFLALVPMILGFVELIGHGSGIWVYDMPYPYTPGLATSIFLLAPVSVITIRYMLKNKMVRARDFLFAFLLMFAGVGIGQQLVIANAGQDYGKFLGNVRKSFFGS